jgi:hypothetical protein
MAETLSPQMRKIYLGLVTENFVTELVVELCALRSFNGVALFRGGGRSVCCLTAKMPDAADGLGRRRILFACFGGHPEIPPPEYFRRPSSFHCTRF